MVIIAEGDKHAEASNAVEENIPQEPPPTYASIDGSASTPASASSESSSAPPPVPPVPPPGPVVNYIAISRVHNSIKETLTIDPSLNVPQSLRPALAAGETESTRKNVRLESVHGSILADINLINSHPMEPQNRRRATIQLSANHGGMKINMADHTHRPPFLLMAKSDNGQVNLSIPRSFTGPITVIYVHGNIKASALGNQFITFGDTDGQMRGFIGDISRYRESEGDRKQWEGDELVVNLKHGNLKLRFHDESSTPVGERVPTTSRRQVKSKQTAFVKRLFGFI